MINNLKLKYQLSLLLLITLFMMVLLQSMYYVRFNSLTRDRAAKLAENIINQVSQSVDYIVSGIEKDAINISYSKYSQEILVSNNTIRNAELSDFVTEIFNHTMATNQNIYSIILLNNKGRQISYSSHYNSDVLKSLEATYDFRSSEFKKAVFSSIVRDSSDAFYYYSYISPVFSSAYMTGDYSKIGNCILLLDTRGLEKLVYTKELTNNSLFMILDSDNKVIVSNKGLKAGDLYKDVFWQEGESNIIKDEIVFAGKKSIVQYKKINSTGWKVISVIPVGELTSDMLPIVSFGIWIGVVMMLLLIVIGSGFIYSTTRPLMLMVKFLSQIGEKNLRQRLEIPYKNEVGIVANNINHMLDKVETMTTKIVENQTTLYESELSKKQAELSALQSQVNPHFLYNTLNCLSNIGIAYNVMEVVSISSAMSKIFRYSIKGDGMVSIEDEVNCIKEYLAIMDIRYNGKFETKIDIEESLMEMKTLKMVLQPVVENAMYHGLEQKNSKGQLLIEGYLSEEGYLQFDIEDNGVGMNEEQLAELNEGIQDYENKVQHFNKKQSIGLVNINKRIKFQFGSQYGLDIVSEKLLGTKVTLK
ncbi:MAG: signal transduction histidine kinase, LytS, partial [Clostridiales bacterium]|nr:signal transduction histidine kinase, LytS [Clostridiales bacterium]